MPTYTDPEILKNRQIGTAADYNMAADPALTVGALHTFYPTIYKTADDAMASTTTAEVATASAPCPVKCIVRATYIRGNLAVVANATDYVTATISYRDSTGGNAVVVAVYDSRAASATTTGALTAFAPALLIPTVANAVCAAGGTFTLTVAKGGAGKILPVSSFTLHCERA